MISHARDMVNSFFVFEKSNFLVILQLTYQSQVRRKKLHKGLGRVAHARRVFEIDVHSY